MNPVEFSKSQKSLNDRISKATFIAIDLLDTLNDWTNGLGAKWGIDTVYIDIRKAVDSVSHPKLLQVLNSFGVSGKLLDWFGSYLSDRSQFVSIGNTASSHERVLSGVPRGSILGPKLFLAYINDLDASFCLKLFADDAKLYSFVNSRTDFSASQYDLNVLDEWM